MARSTPPVLEIGVVLSCGVIALLGLALRRPADGGTASSTGTSERAEGLGPLPRGAAEPAPPAVDPTGDGCHFEDRGLGDYESRALEPGRVLVRGAAVDEDGSFELLVHFHGVGAVQKLLAPEQLDLVIAGLDAGTLSSDYQKVLGSGAGLGAWLDQIDAAVTHAVGRPARARRVTLSSWSAGYGAIDRALQAAPWGERRFGGVILIDSLHAPVRADASVDPAAIAPFAEVAAAAAEGGPLFFLTHSEVPVSGYASTRQVADALLLGLEGRADDVAFGGDDLLTMTRTFERGRVAIRGYAGSDRDAHCAQLRILPSVVAERLLSFAPAE